jgi:cytidylate kinase
MNASVERPSIDLVTVSREFGAGGSELAAALGAALGWPVLDHDIAHRVADRLALEDATVERLDEHPPTWLARITSALLIAPPEAPIGIDVGKILSPDAVAHTVDRIIVESAGEAPLVIVGHAGQLMFRARPGTMHVRLVAPRESRIERLRARFGWDAAHAAAELERTDRDRVAYVQRYYHHDVRDPLLYDLVINTGRVGITEAVALVVARVRGVTPDAGRARS